MRSRFLPSTASSQSNLSETTIEASSAGPQKKTYEKLLISKGKRTYLNDNEGRFIYPLPVDLIESNRHVMMALLTSAVFETPLLSPELLQNPPRRVLEIGCDTGFWSSLCHQYFQSRGHQVSFVGIDIKAPTGVNESYQNLGMDWQYIQYDLREPEWPVEDGSVDLVMARNMALVFDGLGYSHATSEAVRVLKPGGTFELWVHDFVIRSLKPEVQAECDPDHTRLGVYPIGKTDSLGPPINPYIKEYNTWLTTALGDLGLSAMPSALVGPLLTGHLVEGAEALEEIISKRVAVPLSTIKWEREGGRPRVLTKDQAAIRQSTRDNFIGMVEAFESLLRNPHLRRDYEWEEWLERAKVDWMQRSGLSMGECLEFGVFCFKKKID